ncbi:hypothetical protein Avbf_14915, partial [Armadillidium vulgare]
MTNLLRKKRNQDDDDNDRECCDDEDDDYCQYLAGLLHETCLPCDDTSDPDGDGCYYASHYCCDDDDDDVDDDDVDKRQVYFVSI